LSIQYRQRLASHPQVRQREQRDDLRRVLRKPAVADLGEAELPFDHAERMLDPSTGANAGPLAEIGWACAERYGVPA
jgi:hypothetical protein